MEDIATNNVYPGDDKNGKTKEIFGGIITDLIPNEENTFMTPVLANIIDAQDLEIIKIEEE